MSHDLDSLTIKELRKRVREFKHTHCPAIYRMKKEDLISFIREKEVASAAPAPVPEAKVVEAVAEKVAEVVAEAPKKVRKPRIVKAVKEAVKNEIVKVHEADAAAHMKEAKAHVEAVKAIEPTATEKEIYEEVKRGPGSPMKKFLEEKYPEHFGKAKAPRKKKAAKEAEKPTEKPAEKPAEKPVSAGSAEPTLREKKKREAGAYAKFMGERRKAGKSMKEIADEWKAQKMAKPEEEAKKKD